MPSTHFCALSGESLPDGQSKRRARPNKYGPAHLASQARSIIIDHNQLRHSLASSFVRISNNAEGKRTWLAAARSDQHGLQPWQIRRTLGYGRHKIRFGTPSAVADFRQRAAVRLSFRKRTHARDLIRVSSIDFQFFVAFQHIVLNRIRRLQQGNVHECFGTVMLNCVRLRHSGRLFADVLRRTCFGGEWLVRFLTEKKFNGLGLLQAFRESVGCAPLSSLLGWFCTHLYSRHWYT